MKSFPRVLIVEDEAAIAELVAVNLRHNGFTPIWAEDGEAAQRELDAVLPDVVLLDWMLPGQSGLQLARKWRADARSKSIPILMLTARGDEPEKVAGLDAGADDYITKPFSIDFLLARMRALLRRSSSMPVKGQIAFHDIEMDLSTHRVTRNGRRLHLGPTEFRLLEFLIQHPRRVFSREELLDAVWGPDIHVEPRTVDVHIRRLRRAINGEGEMDVVRTVRTAGYALDSDPA